LSWHFRAFGFLKENSSFGESTCNADSFGFGSSSSAWVNGQTSVIGTNSVDIGNEKNAPATGTHSP